jgi:PAS domain S-box-containing protein
MMDQASEFESLEKLQNLTKLLPGIVFEFVRQLDGKNYFSYINNTKILEKYGGSVEEALKDSSKLFGLICQEDLPDFLLSIEKSASDLSVWQHEYRVNLKDGTQATLNGNATPRRAKDGLIIWHGFITDISKHKKQQEALLIKEVEFKNLFDSNGTIMLVIDGETGNLLDANKGAQKFYGYEKSKMLQMNISDINTLSKTEISNILRNAINEKENKYYVVHKLANKELRNVEVYSTPLIVNGKKRLFSIIHDITCRIVKEKKLADYAIQLKESNTALQDFAYIASHDLKSPLTVLNGLFNLLYDDTKVLTEAKRNEYIKYARESVNKMRFLLDDLLTYSLVGKEEDEFVEVDLNKVLKSIIHQLKEEIATTKATITIHPLPIIIANKTLMSELFVNLISNAIKYNKSKTIEIEIGYNLLSNEHLFYVKDNGIGIKEVDQVKVFDIFKRLHTQKDFPGTGIGLAFCKRIVETHKGKIWVESEFEKGSVFYFTTNYRP